MAYRSNDSKDIGVQQSAFETNENGGNNEPYNHVEAKYMGTTVDQREMHALGRIQQLRV